MKQIEEKDIEELRELLDYFSKNNENHRFKEYCEKHRKAWDLAEKIGKNINDINKLLEELEKKYLCKDGLKKIYDNNYIEDFYKFLQEIHEKIHDK